MPLILADIEKELESVFGNLSETSLEASEKWSKAVVSYMQDLVPLSTTHSLGEINFKGMFQTINSTNGLIQLPRCFEAYNDGVIVGMQPLFTATPPPKGVLNFAPVYAIGLAGGSYKDCAEAMSLILFTWYKTGTAVNNNTLVTIPWS